MTPIESYDSRATIARRTANASRDNRASSRVEERREEITPLSLGYVSVDAARGSLDTGRPRR